APAHHTSEPKKKTRSEALLLALDDELRHPEQGALDLRVRECADRFARSLRVLSGFRVRGLYRAIALQHLHDLLIGHALERSLLQHCLHRAAFFRRAALQ